MGRAAGVDVSQRRPAVASAAPAADHDARTAHDSLVPLLARNVDERDRARGPLLQRLIAVNVAGIPHTDYAIMKQVQQLRASQQPAPDAITGLSSATDFSGMAAGEDLYIVSHGDSASGNLRDVEPNALVGWLNHHTRGIPAHFGKIVVLSCYGGMVKSGGQALAAKIAAGINHQGHEVEGALGFSFGTAEFGQGANHSSVLSEDLRVFYMADDVPAMCDVWGARNPTHAGGVLAQPPQSLAYVNEYETIKNQLTSKHGDKKAEGYIRTLIAHFQTRAKAIEEGLRLALSQTAGGTVSTRIATLEAPPVIVGGPLLPNVVQWNALLAEQYQLFHDYYLWTSPDDAFASFTS